MSLIRFFAGPSCCASRTARNRQGVVWSYTIFGCVVIALAVVDAAGGAALAVDHNNVRVHLKGTVGTVCTVGANGGSSAETKSLRVNDVSIAGSQSTTMPINCNAPFAYTVTSQNGGLKRVGGADLHPYSLHVQIPTDISMIDDTCISTSIQAGAATCVLHNSGDGVAMDGQATLSMAWQAASLLAPGDYKDRITLTVMLQH